MKKRGYSVPVNFLLALFTDLVVFCALEATGAYLVYNEMAGEEVMRPAAFLSASISMFLIVLLFKLRTVTQCASLAGGVWGVLVIVGLIFWGAVDVRTSLITLTCFLLGAFLALYITNRFARGKKKGRSSRKKR